MSTGPSTSQTTLSLQPLEVEPEDAHRVFSSSATVGAIEMARKYVDHLATTGVDHGLVGPRELPRLWSRHVLNCAVVSDVVPHGVDVIDVGSGAGLPGIPLAIARADLSIILLEPLERRCRWLTTVIDDLGLADRVQVVRGRAEESRGVLEADVVTSRAVASLPKLLGWSLPLTRPGGQVLAMKGERAPEELDSARRGLSRLGITETGIELCGVDSPEGPVRVVRVVLPGDFDASAVSRAFGGGGGGRTSSRRRARSQRAVEPRGPRKRKKE